MLAATGVATGRLQQLADQQDGRVSAFQRAAFCARIAAAAVVMRQTESFRQKHSHHLKANSEGLHLDLTVATEGIAYSYENPYLLEKAVKTLETLRNEIERRGFEPTTDERLLRILYGERRCLEGIPLRYRACSQQHKEASDEDVRSRIRRDFLEELKKEIQRFQNEIAALQAREEKELPLEEESLSIPMGMELDRLLRYRTHIEKSFDRTLAQLERVQRLRVGLPVPPGSGPRPEPSGPLFAVWLGLPVLAFFGTLVFSGRRKQLAFALAVGLLVLAMLPLAGCNNGDEVVPVPSVGTFQVRGVIGTSVENSNTVTVTVD